MSPAFVKHHIAPTTRPGGGIPYSAKRAKTDPKIGASPMPLTAAPVHKSHGAAISVPDKKIISWPTASTGSVQQSVQPH
eukprot:COSAG02_NODE_6087_length_3812_cov_3.269324_4_plen_79_part_00